MKGSAWTLDTATKLVKNTVTTDAVCTQLNKSAGVDSAKVSSAVAAYFATKTFFQFKH